MHCIALHGMAYYIFLKSLRSLEEFKKNPHIRIPPKSPCTNFQSLGIFKNLIFIPKGFFSSFRPSRPVGWFTLSAHAAHPGLFFLLHQRRSKATSSSRAAVPWPPHHPPPAPWRDPNGRGPLYNSAASSIDYNHPPLLHSGNDCHLPPPPGPPLPGAPSAPIKGDEHPWPSPPFFPSLVA
jgi:hypothetical protein